jgi:hypothetical protein
MRFPRGVQCKPGQRVVALAPDAFVLTIAVGKVVVAFALAAVALLMLRGPHRRSCAGASPGAVLSRLLS